MAPALRWRLAAAAPAVAIALLVSPSATAAAPRYIMVTGPGLTSPVLLDDWSENLRFMAAISYGSPVARAQLPGRPRFLVSLFWNATVWTEPPTAPSGANQSGWFYPAYDKRVPVFWLVRSYSAPGALRRATTELLAIFRAHGVPTRCAVTRDVRTCGPRS